MTLVRVSAWLVAATLHRSTFQPNLKLGLNLFLLEDIFLEYPLAKLLDDRYAIQNPLEHSGTTQQTLEVPLQLKGIQDRDLQMNK